MSGLIHDLKSGFRALRASPLSTAAGILVIALGTGANMAVFAIAYGVLLRPLPYPDASRLVILSISASDGSDFGMSLERVDAWRDRLRTVESVAAYATGELTLRGAGEPRLVRTAFVTESFFDVLGVPAARGQLAAFRESAEVAVVADGLSAHFEGDGVTVGDRAFRIGAVMPPAFAFPADRVEVWVPGLAAAPGNGPDMRRFRVLARLEPGVSLPQFRDDAVRVMRELHGPEAAKPGGAHPGITPVEEAIVGGMRPVLGATVAAAFLVLLVTSANVAMLLLGRAVLRRRDSAVRMALGAGRWQLVRLSLAESFLLAAFGTLAGLWLAVVGVRLFVRTAADVVPRTGAVAIDAPVLAAAAALVFLVTLLCGASPALRMARKDFLAAFRGAAGEPRTRRALSTLVVGQIAVSMVLATGAVLLARTVTQLLEEDTGIRPSSALAVRLQLGDGTGVNAARRTAFVRDVLDRVRALPGVEQAGVGSSLPPDRLPFQIFVTVKTATRREGLRMSAVSATPGFLEALGAHLVSGRTFTESDGLEPPAVLVSETTARFYFPGPDPVGRELPWKLPPVAPFSGPPRVLGVVRDVKYEGLDMPAAAGVYLPWSARPTDKSFLVVRAAGDPASLVPAVRRVLREADPELPIPQIRTLRDEMAHSIVDRRLRVVPALGFAGVALAVALTGVFALLARAAAERRRELAIRMALGASERRVTTLMMRRAVLLTVAGLLTGLAGSAVVTNALRGLLYGVGPHDPLTFTGVVTLVGGASLLAAFLPAWRAARVEVWELLRSE